MTPKLAHVRTLVVRCPNWVGDIVMATPVFECLRANLPDVKIVGILKAKHRDILGDSPWFDDFVDLGDKNRAEFHAMRSRLRELQPDAGILLTNSFRSARMLRRCGVPTLYGYRREGRSFMLAGGPEVQRDAHGIVPLAMTEYYMEICRWLGLTLPAEIKPRLYIGQELQQRGRAVLDQYGIAPTDLVVGLNPGACFGVSKRWPPEYFAEVARMCRNELGAKVMVFSGPGEEDIVQAIVEAAQTDLIDVRVDLELLKPLVQRCDLMITNDTGPRHYAVALDVPTVVMMGPIDPRYTNSNLETSIVLRKELDCSPCRKRVCAKQHECMRGITPREVFEAAQSLLKARV